MDALPSIKALCRRPRSFLGWQLLAASGICAMLAGTVAAQPRDPAAEEAADSADLQPPAAPTDPAAVVADPQPAAPPLSATPETAPADQSSSALAQERAPVAPPPPAARQGQAAAGNKTPTAPHPAVQPDSQPPAASRALQLAQAWLGATDLEWHGGLELDVGHARYSFDTAAYPKENFYDFRGRFVLGPMLTHHFGPDLFLRAKAELVAWVRETYGVYQINVDDVWAQVGYKKLLDLKVGRYETWPIYHKGLGFDLYTLDDTGAIETPPYESGLFGPDIYEVNFIYLRETPGRAAIHIFPTAWSGVELAGAYGKDGTSNTAGWRGAGFVDLDFLRLTAGGEYRYLIPAQETTAQDPQGDLITCDKCGFTQRYGFGGGAVLRRWYTELGFNIAYGGQKGYAIKDGTFDKNSSWNTTSLGGYLEFDAGSLVLKRPVIAGFGINRTEVLFENEDFKRHVQWAAYAAYPLGFNNALVKLVISRADLLTEDNTGDGVNFLARQSRMLAGRVRLLFPF